MISAFVHGINFYGVRMCPHAYFLCHHEIILNNTEFIGVIQIILACTYRTGTGETHRNVSIISQLMVRGSSWSLKDQSPLESGNLTTRIGRVV